MPTLILTSPMDIMKEREYIYFFLQTMNGFVMLFKGMFSTLFFFTYTPLFYMQTLFELLYDIFLKKRFI